MWLTVALPIFQDQAIMHTRSTEGLVVQPAFVVLVNRLPKWLRWSVSKGRLCPALQSSKLPRATWIQLFQRSDTTGIVVQSLPQHSHITLPAQLPTYLEELCSLQVHRTVQVKGPSPGMVRWTKAFLQKALEVMQLRLPILPSRSFCLLVLHTPLLRFGLQPVALAFWLQPKQIAHPDAIVAVAVQGLEKELRIILGPAALLQAFNPFLAPNEECRATFCLCSRRCR
mmetsp:Transcript_51634/g.92748  ORF Transcript_51634/g.92748 Transcript_51634/m.92748 type:complete len:227 (+) Transcript_51634:1244-1924(+)